MGAKSKLYIRLLGRMLRIALKVLWVSSMVVVPFLGMWLSSSLAAYHNRSVVACIAFGLLLFPIIPLLWDQFYLWRDRKKTPERARILTTIDRMVLRTLSINLIFVVSILSIAPTSAFRAISTRGDWVFDGYDGPISNTARRVIFRLADLLEGRWDHGESFYGESDDGPNTEPTNSDSEVGKAQEVKVNIPPKIATEHWPLKSEIHSAVLDMPESVQGSYQDVAHFLQRRFEDPFERSRAIHDYIVLRLSYDYETRDKIVARDYSDLPSQRAEPIFAARIGVCEGYARLMRAMGEEAGLEVAYIVGNARFLMQDSEGVGHAWNAVRIGGQWYLMDVTWDDGTTEKHGYTYQTTYLNTPPELFGIDHFPDNPSWQLKESPLSIGEFMRQPDLRPDFSLFDFEMIEPTRSQVTVSGAFHMTIGNPRAAYIMATWKPKTSLDKGEKCTVLGGDPIEITCDLPSDGEFLVVLFGNDEQYGSYSEVAKQLVNSR